SAKTDDELMEPGVFPEIVRFHPTSPYVRREIDALKPADVANARWEQILPRLRQLSSDAIRKYQETHPPQPSIDPFDAAAHRASASAVLLNGVVAKLDRRLWSGDDKPLVEAFQGYLDEHAVTDALSDSLARIEL